MKKTTEYHEHAQECRALAARTSDPDRKSMLVKMAETWEMLAVERHLRLEQQKRIAVLESEHSEK